MELLDTLPDVKDLTKELYTIPLEKEATQIKRRKEVARNWFGIDLNTTIEIPK